MMMAAARERRLQHTGNLAKEFRRVHFVGIGGSGMSGIAEVLCTLGYEVSGSDNADNAATRRLASLGARVMRGHNASNVLGTDCVVVSSAIKHDNPELMEARSQRIPIVPRAAMLAELMRFRRGIAVAGTHGKTTTTGMLIWAMRNLGMDPAFFIGGELPSVADDGGPSNSGWGEGEWAVVEADESDGSFLVLDPEVAVVTNIEMDHHSRWSGLVELRQAFTDFTGKARAAVLPQGEDELAASLDGTDFEFFDGEHPGPDPLGLVVPGGHNRLNARAAIGALEAAGVDPAEAAGAMADFPGVKRRLEYKGMCEGSRVYDDYAHHPTEVEAALTALRDLEPKKLVAIFQPHLYSRTKVFRDSFGAALALADEVIVLDVYPAREMPVGPLAGISGMDVLRAVADRSGGRASWWAPTLDAAERAARDRAVEGGILVTIGAGDITKVSDRLTSKDAADG